MGETEPSFKISAEAIRFPRPASEVGLLSPGGVNCADWSSVLNSDHEIDTGGAGDKTTSQFMPGGLLNARGVEPGSEVQRSPTEGG